MKILFINSFLSSGGPPRIIKGLYDALTEQGHECLLAAAREKPIDGMNVYVIGNHSRIYMNAIESRLFDNDGFVSSSETRKLIDIIKNFEPDIVHIHNLHGYYINSEILFNYLKSVAIPVIWTFHDCWPFTGHCAYFDGIGCEKWLNGCGGCKQKQAYPKSIVDWSKRNWARKRTVFCGLQNATIVTPSRWLADVVKKSFLQDYRIEVVNNGVDLEQFHPVDSDFRVVYGLCDSFLIVSVAAVWDERKGFSDYIKLARLLDDSMALVMVGVTKKQKESLPAKIIGIEKTESVQELAEIYSAADVFLNLTYEDNFPTVNIEALACGTPIITYDTGGSPEIADSENEIVCKRGDIDRIYDAIRETKNSGGLKKTAALRKNAMKYTKEEMTEKYMEIYLRASSNKSGGVLLYSIYCYVYSYYGDFHSSSDEEVRVA